MAEEGKEAEEKAEAVAEAKAAAEEVVVEEEGELCRESVYNAATRQHVYRMVKKIGRALEGGT